MPDRPGSGHRAAAQPLVGIEAVSRSFGAAQALREVSVALLAGEVHGLVGESDAGKSAIVDILGGVSEPDSGQLVIDGMPTALRGPAAAIAADVSIIPQQPVALARLSAAETIFRERQPVGAGRRLDLAEMRRRADSVLARLGVELDPARPASGLSVADRQIVEIAKAVSFGARVILMDEPTTVLSPVEASRLLGVIRALCAEGAAVLFVSHRIEEIFEVCQRVTIMREGRLVRTAAVQDVTIDQVIHLITGRKPDATAPRAGAPGADVVLEVEALTRGRVFSDVSFQVRRGEIVALTGLEGAGGSEIARAVAGLDRRDAGRVAVGGCELPNGSPQAAMNAGIAFVPEDRRRRGLSRRGLSRRGLSRRARGRPGGSQDKEAALGRWVARRPPVLVIDEPTRGTDVGTMARMHWMLDRLLMDGTAILMVSSELQEVLEMADRVLVLRDGSVAQCSSSTCKIRN